LPDSASIAWIESLGPGKYITPSWTSGVPSWCPASSGRTQTMRNWSTFAVVIWSSGL
jgi:hypothetical protein